MYRDSNTVKKWLISITLFLAVPCVCIYEILQFLTCPVLISNGSVNRISNADVQSLIDFPKLVKKSENLKNKSDETIHSVFWYNIPEWISIAGMNNDFQKCAYRNCRMTTDDKKSMKYHSALLFSLFKPIGKTPPLQTHERPRDQVWAFINSEPSMKLWRKIGTVSDAWRSTMNWSMTYRLDSDIVCPYGTLQSRDQPPNRDYHNIYRRKSKFAAWIVSNCFAESDRSHYVQELRNYGIPVDIYGKCGEMGQANRSYLVNVLNNDYKFYFAFENSLCPDYITEKFFDNFNLNVVLVVRGGADYSKLLPKDAFIDASKYNSIQALADFLIKVNSSETMYSSFLKRKDKYVSVSPFEYSFCKFCEMLNHKEEHTNVYDDVNEYLYLSEYSCKECKLTGSPMSRLKWIASIIVLIVLIYLCLLLSLLHLPVRFLFLRLHICAKLKFTKWRLQY